MTTNGRDHRGRFVPANPGTSLGGKSRAERLIPEQRRQIAAQGWAGLVARHFAGDPDRAATWLGQLSAWASDAPYRDRFPVFQHPGPCPGGEK